MRHCVPVLFATALVCAVLGVGGAAICLFITHEPVWQPFAFAAGSFVLLPPSALAIAAFSGWWENRD
jgi:hypothetical protein